MAIRDMEALLTPPALHIVKEEGETSSYHYCSPTRNSSTSTTANMGRDPWRIQPQSLTVIKKRRNTPGQSQGSDDGGAFGDSAANPHALGQGELQMLGRLTIPSHI